MSTFRYKITENGTDEKELKKEGFLYVLGYVQTRGRAAKSILGYDLGGAESSYASVTFPSGQLQLKTIPADKEIYKFYFRHIGNGNVDDEAATVARIRVVGRVYRVVVVARVNRIDREERQLA